jgi:hypothetical protein
MEETRGHGCLANRWNAKKIDALNHFNRSPLDDNQIIAKTCKVNK